MEDWQDTLTEENKSVPVFGDHVIPWSRDRLVIS